MGVCVAFRDLLSIVVWEKDEVLEGSRMKLLEIRGEDDSVAAVTSTPTTEGDRSDWSDAVTRYAALDAGHIFSRNSPKEEEIIR